MVVAQIYSDAVDGKASLYINTVNLLEVYYGLIKSFDATFADIRLREITESIIEITNLTRPKLVEAGRLKSEYKVSLADAIALAEAYVSGGTLITADHHEMDVVEQREKIEFLWIR